MLIGLKAQKNESKYEGSEECRKILGLKKEYKEV